MTQCQDEFRNLSGWVSEILTASRIDINFFWKSHEKAYVHNFPTMYIMGGVNVFEMGQINDFVQILGLKTTISADTFLDHLALEGSVIPKLEIL